MTRLLASPTFARCDHRVSARSGSSLASAYLGSASITLAANTGGVQLPGLVAGDGATGTVTLTFNGLAVPGVPTGVTATPGHTQASVSFTAPADGGSPITSYTVTASPGGATATCPGSPCTVTGLTDGTAYTFTVHATNENGDSPESSASSAVTPAQRPDAPTAVQATGSDESASVSWTAPDNNGGSPVTSYTVTSSPGNKTATCSASPCVVAGLENGTDYTFSVVATNAIGSSEASEPSGSTSVRTVPGAPEITQVTGSNGSVTATFTAPAIDGGAAVTSYVVEATPGSASATCSSSPCTIDGLANGTTYTLRVRAVNAAGSSEASDPSESVTPATVPDAPTGLEVKRGDTEADLTFDGPANDGGATITRWDVSTDGGQTWSTLDVQGSGPYTATVTGLANGTKYDIAVRAANDEGPGAATQLSNVTPAGHPGTPSGVTAVRGNGQVEVSWTSPDDNGAAIDGYEVNVIEQGAPDRVVSCTSSPCTIDGLTNGTGYGFQVRAHNAVGSSSFSDLSDLTVPATTAQAPALVELYSGDGSLAVKFTPTGKADDGGDEVTGYEYSLNDGPWQFLASNDAGDGNQLGIIDGLQNGKSLSLRLRAVNGVGGGDPSVGVDQTPATVPDAPQSVKVSSSKGSTTVTWKAPTSDGGSPITGYTVTAQPGGTVCQAAGEDSRSCTFTDLQAGQTYEFSVSAVNTAENRSGTGVSVATTSGPVLVTDAPGAPAQLSVVPGDRTAKVSFTVPVSDGGKPILGYEVSTDDGDTWQGVATTAVSGSTTERTTTIGYLLNGSTYLISVRALNADGAGVGTPSDPTTLKTWFSDPIGVADRTSEIAVPADPGAYKGPLVHTVATNRSADGTTAANEVDLAQRQLQPKQAVQMPRTGMFTYDKATLTKKGKATIKAMTKSLTYVRTVRCEAFADYAGSKKHANKLTKARAEVVCKAIEKEAKQVSTSTTIGYGEDHPVIVGGSKSQRSENRRVVVVVEK